MVQTLARLLVHDGAAFAEPCGYSPKRCKHYADVNGAIEEWENNVAIFSKAEGTTDMKESTKMYAIKQIAPEELEKDM